MVETARRISRKVHINPRLAKALGIQAASATTVKLSDLPSTYARSVNKKREVIARDNPENKQWLRCRACGERGRYDVGFVSVHPEWVKRLERSAASGDNDENRPTLRPEFEKYIQFTGYFRCEHCGAADGWSVENEFFMFLIAAVAQLDLGSDEDEIGFQFGHIRTFDGYEGQSSTDLEEHLLMLIEQRPQDAFLWNRLGNVYNTGGVPELAVVAYEKSLACDCSQVESHVSLSRMLFEILNLDAGIQHGHLALAHARFYTKLDSTALRKMLCVVLDDLATAALTLGDIGLYLPPRELMEEVASAHGEQTAKLNKMEEYRDFEPVVGDPASFGDLADVYLGRTRNQKGRRNNKNRKKRRR